MAVIDRDLAPLLMRAAADFPAVTLTGPRQSGKSTLCRSHFRALPYVSLEALDTRSFAEEDPRAFLAQFPDGAIIDEVQRVPAIMSYLQGIIDANPVPGRWILTGSHNFALMRDVGQSLAGRSAVLHLLPMARSEVARFPQFPRTLDEAMIAGGYPRIFDRNLDAAMWLGSYVSTYVERDVRSISNIGDLATFRRFLELCAGRTGQILNHASLASDCGISQPTAKAWFGVLEASFIAFRLPPFHANLSKRLVKMPKLHFYDTGLVCWLLGIRTPAQLRSHPLRGAIFETWVVSEIMKHRLNRGERTGLFFYRDRDGLEADVVIEMADRLIIVEAKASQTASSSLFDGVRRVGEVLAMVRGRCETVVAYAGDEGQRRSDVSLVPWSELHEYPWA